MTKKDYYNILGISGDATQQTIKEAYRNLAFQYHPDKNEGNPAATRKMKEVNEAYAVLSDPSKRREYDFLRSQYGTTAYDRFRSGHTTEDIFRGSDIDQVFEEFARTFGYRGFADIFKEAYKSDPGAYNFQKSSFPGKGYMFFSAQQKRRGQHQNLNTNSNAANTVFQGAFGTLARSAMEQILGIKLPQKGKDHYDKIKLNYDDFHAGGEIKYLLNKESQSRRIMVKIPPHITSGQQLKLKGLGAPGIAGGEPGDLYLKIIISKSLGQRVKGFFKKFLANTKNNQP